MSLVRWYVVLELRKALEDKMVELLQYDYDLKTARKKALRAIRDWAEDGSGDQCLYCLWQHR